MTDLTMKNLSISTELEVKTDHTWGIGKEPKSSSRPQSPITGRTQSPKATSRPQSPKPSSRPQSPQKTPKQSSELKGPSVQLIQELTDKLKEFPFGSQAKYNAGMSVDETKKHFEDLGYGVIFQKDHNENHILISASDAMLSKKDNQVTQLKSILRRNIQSNLKKGEYSLEFDAIDFSDEACEEVTQYFKEVAGYEAKYTHIEQKEDEDGEEGSSKVIMITYT